MERTVHPYGSVTGKLWMPPSQPAAKPLRRTLDLDPGKRASEAIKSAVSREGGDFSGAPLLAADTLITLRHTYRRNGRTTVTRERSFEAAELPGLVDFVAADLYCCDFFGEE
jgi:hypothetical protein